MTDDEARRADRFIAVFREMIAATIVDPSSPCANEKRGGLQRIAATVDQVDYVHFANLANLNAALRGGLMDLIEVRSMCARAARHWTMPTRWRFSMSSRR